MTTRTIRNGSTVQVPIAIGETLKVVAVSGTYTITVTQGTGQGTALATGATGGSYGPYAYASQVSIVSSVQSEIDFDVAVSPVVESDTFARLNIDPLTGMVTGLVGPDGEAFNLMRSTVYDNFATKSDGPVSLLDSGQNYVLQHTLDANRLRVISGRLTNTTTDAAQAAGYAEVTFSSPVNRIGGTWEFGAKTTANGSATFAIWTAPYPGTGPVSDSPLHLSITTTKWTLSYFEGGVMTDIATGDFATELAQDGTLYSADALISGTTVYLSLPDGSRFKVSNAFVASNAGNIAVFEVFATNASTDSKVKFSSVFADDSSTTLPNWKAPSRSEVYDMVARELAAWLPTTVYYSPGVANNVTIPLTMTTLDSTNMALTFTAPPTGRVIIYVQAFVSSTTRVLFALEQNTAGVSFTGSTHDVTGIAMNGVADYSAQVTGLVPGRSYKFSLRGQAITSTATLLADLPNGRVLFMTARPY